MKLYGIRLAAVAALVGSVAMVQAPDAAAAVYVPAPPPLRMELVGPAPSTHHLWIHGYWRWDSPRATYVWAPGYWQDETLVVPYAPPRRVYEDPGYAPGADYFFIPGYWRWRGGRYAWAPGHWSLRRDAYLYYRHGWDRAHGHWEHWMQRWDRYGDWERDNRADWARGHGVRGGWGHGAVHAAMMHPGGAWRHAAPVHATGLRAGGHHGPQAAPRHAAAPAHHGRR